MKLKSRVRPKKKKIIILFPASKAKKKVMIKNRVVTGR
jgi:hypothetical protein